GGHEGVEEGRKFRPATNPGKKKKESPRRGDAIYEKDILPKLSAKDVGKFLAIDIETGEYEIARNELRACDKLRKRIPDAQIWMVRVGYRSVHSFGGRNERQERP